MEKRVLITGVSGFAGSYLAPSLAEAGYTVLGTAHIAGASIAGVSKMFKVDLRNYADIEAVVQETRPTHVIHLAAIAFVGHQDVAEIYETNIVGSRNLLQALVGLETKPVAVLLTSSANIYGNSTKGILTETDEPNPVNDYAVSKIAMEYMARQYNPRLNITIVRPFNYTGRGQAESFLVPKIVNHFLKKAPVIELGNTDVSRDFTDVRAVAEYCKRLLEQPAAAGETYNICSGEPISLQFIIDTCRRLSGHDIEVRVNPAFVRPNEIKTLAGDASKLRAAVGEVTSYRLDETLAWMLSA